MLSRAQSVFLAGLDPPKRSYRVDSFSRSPLALKKMFPLHLFQLLS